MSRDYPNRAEWLSVRATHSPKARDFAVIWPRGTFLAGRNLEKRRIRTKDQRTQMLANRRLRQRGAP